MRGCVTCRACSSHTAPTSWIWHGGQSRVQITTDGYLCGRTLDNAPGNKRDVLSTQADGFHPKTRFTLSLLPCMQDGGEACAPGSRAWPVHSSSASVASTYDPTAGRRAPPAARRSSATASSSTGAIARPASACASRSCGASRCAVSGTPARQDNAFSVRSLRDEPRYNPAMTSSQHLGKTWTRAG